MERLGSQASTKAHLHKPPSVRTRFLRSRLRYPEATIFEEIVSSQAGREEVLFWMIWEAARGSKRNQKSRY